MKKKKKREKLPKVLHVAQEEIYNLLEMFEFYLIERQLNKPIEILSDSVRDLRIIIQQIVMEYFLAVDLNKTERFMTSLAAVLVKRSMVVPVENKEDKRYIDYCIGEIITAFEWAVEIMREFPDDLGTQRILALDIPVLRPFDYGLRSKIRLVSPPKRLK